MVELDDRTGNILTTIALFAIVAAIAYATRTTIAVFVLALLFAYLLEPAVTWVHLRLTPRASSRNSAIAVVYVVGLSIVAALDWMVAPAVTEQLQRLDAALPGMMAKISDHRFLADYASQIAAVRDRIGHALGAAAADTGWLLLVPLIAIFFLSHRTALIAEMVNLFARRRDRARVTATVERVDSMLAEYVRAQLVLASMSALVYTVSMAFLHYPYPLVLGIVGGALEFIPIAGWLIAAAMMLFCGWLVGAPWIWMAVVIAVWKTVEGVVVSPRIMGHRLAIDPITVLFALMVGGQIGGLLGVILSVPAAAVLRILWLERSGGESENAAAA
jgi:predicted PurR-regulated permease PerM